MWCWLCRLSLIVFVKIFKPFSFIHLTNVGSLKLKFKPKKSFEKRLLPKKVKFDEICGGLKFIHRRFTSVTARTKNKHRLTLL